MNEFEKDVQHKSNDAVESAVGFVVPFLFFSIIFFTAVVIKAIG